MAQTDLPATGSSPQTPGSADDARNSTDYQIQVASRVSRLPPYMFGQINALLYEKRRAGHDVIDLGMGNPSDPPQPQVIEKLAEAAADPRSHGYSQSNGILNLRREVASKYLKNYGVRLDPELPACQFEQISVDGGRGFGAAAAFLTNINRDRCDSSYFRIFCQRDSSHECSAYLVSSRFGVTK